MIRLWKVGLDVLVLAGALAAAWFTVVR